MAKKASRRNAHTTDTGMVPAARPRARVLDWRTVSPERLQGRGAEILTYRANTTELLKYKGEYVLIKGDKVLGIYPDAEQALNEADDRFRDEGALVKRIVAREPIHSLGGAAF